MISAFQWRFFERALSSLSCQLQQGVTPAMAQTIANSSMLGNTAALGATMPPPHPPPQPHQARLDASRRYGLTFPFGCLLRPVGPVFLS